MNRKTQTLMGMILLLLLLSVLALLLQSRRYDELQSAIKSGQFETHYTAAIDTLRTRIDEVSRKLDSGIPTNLHLLSEDQPEALPPEENEDEDPDTPHFGTITLNGIYMNSTMPLAEINGRICRPGDRIAGYTLEEIQPYQVILSDIDGTRITNSLIHDAESVRPVQVNPATSTP